MNYGCAALIAGFPCQPLLVFQNLSWLAAEYSRVLVDLACPTTQIQSAAQREPSLGGGGPSRSRGFVFEIGNTSTG